MITTDYTMWMSSNIHKMHIRLLFLNVFYQDLCYNIVLILNDLVFYNSLAMIKLVQFALLSFLTIAIIGCSDPEPTGSDNVIADDFTLNGTWYFQVVAGDGMIQGVSTSDEDSEPRGFVTFNDDGTGISDFDINLLDRPYGKQEIITWERLSNEQVLITESDGDEDLWNLVRANENVVEATWEIFFSDSNNAVITAVLTANP